MKFCVLTALHVEDALQNIDAIHTSLFRQAAAKENNKSQKQKKQKTK